MRLELGATAGGVPFAPGSGIAQVEAARAMQTVVEAGETGNGRRDQLTDTGVVLHQPEPVHRAFAQCRGGDAGDDGRLRTHLRRQRLQLAPGGVDHAERVFHGDRLRAAGLAVDVGAAEAGQDQRVAAHGQVAAVELGADLYGQLAVAQRLLGARGVRRGLGEVAAQTDEYLDLPGEHGLDAFHGVVAGLTRHRHIELALQCIEQRKRRPLVDAHGAVALHVAVAAHRAGTSAGLAEVAAQLQQVGDFLDGRHRVTVLGDAHRPADDGLFGVAVDCGCVANGFAVEPRLLLDQRPGRGFDLGQIGVQPVAVLSQKRVIEHCRRAAGLRFLLPLQQVLGDAAQHR